MPGRWRARAPAFGHPGKLTCKACHENGDMQKTCARAQYLVYETLKPFNSSILTCMRVRVARVRLHRVPETIRTYTDMITK